MFDAILKDNPVLLGRDFKSVMVLRLKGKE